MDRDHRRLSEADRRLLGLARAKAAGRVRGFSRGSRAARRSRRWTTRARSPSTRLQGYAEQRLLRSAGAAMGLRDPYFLLHEGDAGASTVIDGRRMLNFSSYDYLGLNRHPAVRAAAREAIDRYGVSASASRLVAGERPVHRALEAALARHYGQEACLTFVSGHAANVSTIGALLGPRDLVVHDALAHNSIVMGAQLSRPSAALSPTTTSTRSIRCWNRSATATSAC